MKLAIQIIKNQTLKQKNLQLVNKINRDISRIIDELKDKEGKVNKEELDSKIKELMEKYKKKYSIEFLNKSFTLSSVSLGDSKLENDELHINISTYENRDLDFVFPQVEFRDKEK